MMDSQEESLTNTGYYGTQTDSKTLASLSQDSQLFRQLFREETVQPFERALASAVRPLMDKLEDTNGQLQQLYPLGPVVCNLIISFLSRWFNLWISLPVPRLLMGTNRSAPSILPAYWPTLFRGHPSLSVSRARQAMSRRKRNQSLNKSKR